MLSPVGSPLSCLSHLGQSSEQSERMKDLPFNHCISGCLSVPLVIHVRLTAEQFIDSSNVHIHLTHPMTLCDFSTLFPTTSHQVSPSTMLEANTPACLWWCCALILCWTCLLGFVFPPHILYDTYIGENKLRRVICPISSFLELPRLTCLCAIKIFLLGNHVILRQFHLFFTCATLHPSTVTQSPSLCKASIAHLEPDITQTHIISFSCLCTFPHHVCRCHRTKGVHQPNPERRSNEVEGR